MKLDTALTHLYRDPMTFLRNNLLSISGFSRSGIRPYYFGYYSGKTSGVNEAFKFAPDAFSMDSQKTGIDGKNRTLKQVHSVRMNPSTEDLDISAIDPYVLDGGGPDIMLTGQLSACIFVVQQLPGRLVVGHIQPGGTRQTATMLRQTLKLIGRFQGHGRITHVFGHGDYHPRAHVVGLRTGGAWHLYAQVTASGSGPVTNVVQIL